MASSREHRLAKRLSCNSPRVKVSLLDTRLYRRASQHSTLTSFQQLRKDSLIAARRVHKRSRHSLEERWVEQRLRHDLQQRTCQRKRLRR
jgi:hypothetical protein